MDCEKAKTLFIDYHDGDMGKGEAKALKAHLESCDECRQEWQDYQKMMEEVSGLHSLAPSEDFVSKVKQTIDKRSKGRFFGTTSASGINFAIISFILILLFLAAYLFISAGSEVEVINTPDNVSPDDIVPDDDTDEI